MDEEALLKHSPRNSRMVQTMPTTPMRRPQHKVPIPRRTRLRTMPINRPQPLIPNNS